jgi:hypothetical protein
MVSKYYFVIKLLRIVLFSPPLPFSPHPNWRGGFRVRVLISRFLDMYRPRNLDAVGWGVAWVALWRAFPQTQKLVF